jgi:hypothetical protein
MRERGKTAVFGEDKGDGLYFGWKKGNCGGARGVGGSETVRGDGGER